MLLMTLNQTAAPKVGMTNTGNVLQKCMQSYRQVIHVCQRRGHRNAFSDIVERRLGSMEKYERDCGESDPNC